MTNEDGILRAARAAVRVANQYVAPFGHVLAKRIGQKEFALLQQLHRRDDGGHLAAGIEQVKLVAAKRLLRFPVAPAGVMPVERPVVLHHEHVHARNAVGDQ